MYLLSSLLTEIDTIVQFHHQCDKCAGLDTFRLPGLMSRQQGRQNSVDRIHTCPDCSKTTNVIDSSVEAVGRRGLTQERHSELVTRGQVCRSEYDDARTLSNDWKHFVFAMSSTVRQYDFSMSSLPFGSTLSMTSTMRR